MDNTQVIIYLDSPDGQLIQVGYASYLSYWRLIGWHLYGKASELPNMPRDKQHGGLQPNLI